MSKIKKAILWSVMDMYLVYALKFFFALAIARMLTPHDYGLIAYTSIFMSLASYFSGVGYSAALIQKKDPTEIDYSTGFYFNLFLKFIFVIVYFIFAGKIADYFNEPDLKLVFRVASLNLIINALFSVHAIKLTKTLKFKEHAIINFFSTLLGSIIGVIWALVYKNYWALVFQTFSGTFFKMIGYWYFLRWKPILAYSWESWRTQFKFGSKVFLQGVIETLSRESYTYFIGKFHSTSSLGIYNRALQFYNLFVVQLSVAFNKVLYPTMSQYVVDENEKKRVYHKSYLTIFAVFAPLSIYFYLNAHSIVLILLSNRWLSIVPFFKILFLGGFVSCLLHFNSTTLLSFNKSGWFLKLEFVNKAVLFVVLIVTFRLGVEFILWGWLLSQYFIYLISEITIGVFGYFESKKYFKMIWILVAIIPYVVFHFFIIRYTRNYYLVSILNFLVLMLTYISVLKLTLKEVFETFISLFKLKPIGKNQANLET